jgi:hypothetical protein
MTPDPPPIVAISECAREASLDLISSVDCKFVKSLIPENLLQKGTYYVARGDGKCFFNATLVQVIKMYPEISVMSYEYIMGLIESFLKKYPDPSENANDMDQDICVKTMKDLLSALDIPQPNFIVVSFGEIDSSTENRYSYYFSSDGSNNLENTFILLHKNNHFDALYFPVEERKLIYGIFSALNSGVESVFINAMFLT